MALDESTVLPSRKSHLLANLPAACCSLGFTRKGTYYLGKYCKESIRELIRYLRRDDVNHTARRYLGNAKILVLDLLPLIKHYYKDEELFDLVLRLLVNLTNPVLLLYREELPSDSASRRCYLQIVSQLQVYKEAFTDHTIWTVLVNKLTSILKIDSSERSEETGMIAERILVLIRNILQVPADPAAEERPDCDANIHDQVIWALRESSMSDLILYLSSAESEQAYCMHILEIICLILRDQSGTELAQSQAQRSLEERAQDVAQLMSTREQERMMKLNKIRSSLVTRHPRFGGSFVLRNVKGIGEHDLVVHKPYTDVDKVSHGVKKTKTKRRKNEMPLQDEGEKRRSPFGIRLFLQKFCNEFLSGSYNPLMRYVKGCLQRRVAQPNDESFYLWALKFFMEFNRTAKNEIKLVSETMNVTTFYWVIIQLEHCHGMLKADKKKLLFWSRRAHLAIRAYQELLSTLLYMECSPDSTVRQSAQVIQGNLFYVVEHREALLLMVNSFEETKMSRSYLQDLIETLHIFTKLLERFCKKQRGLVVQTKRVRRKKSKKSAPATAKAPEKVVSNEELWDEVAPQLSTVLTNGEIPEDVVPFDAASDQSIDDQKVDAMRKIHTMLKTHQYEEAVGLLRASREVWQDNNIFGRPNAAPEEELMTLREVFFADIAQDPDVAAAQAVPEDEHQNEYEEDEEFEEDEEDEEGIPTYSEKEFDFGSFLRRLLCSKAIQPACKLLSTFETNSPSVNHCVAKLLHRVCWEAKAPALLFQASLFIQFRKIIASNRPEHQELAKLGIFVFRKFAEVAQKNSLAFVELLFWKNAKEAMDMEGGYEGTNEESAASKKMWKEEEEDELRRLHSEYFRDEPDEDMIDWILHRLINKNRTKAAVKKKLRDLFLILPAKKNARPPKDWSEAEIGELTQLYDEYKDSNDPMEHILTGLTVKRGKAKVLDKLLELGLVSDRKQLYKKSRSKAKVRRAGGSSSSGSEGSDSDSHVRRTKQPKKKANKQNAGVRDRAALKKARRSKGPVSVGQLTAILLQVMDADMREGVQWLLESLDEAANDLEAEDSGDSSEGVPLVPIEEAAVAAMDNPLFHRLLQNLGISPPFDEQEVYWRIPEDLTAAQIREKTSLLQAALDGTLSKDVEFLPEEEGSDNIDEPAVVSPKQRKKKPGKNKDREFIVRTSSSEDDVDDPAVVSPKQRKKKPGKNKENRSILSASSSEDDGETPAVISPKQTKKKSSKNKGNRSIISASSSEDDSDQPAVVSPKQKKKKSSKNKGNRSIVSASSSEDEMSMEEPSEQAREENRKSKSKRSTERSFLESDSDSEKGSSMRNKGKGTKGKTASSKKKHQTQKKSVLDSSSGSELEMSAFSKSNDETSKIERLISKSLAADPENQLVGFSGKEKKKKTKRIRLNSEEEDTTVHTDREGDENDLNSGNATTLSTRKASFLDSDSDGEANRSQPRRRVLSDSEEDKPKSSQKRRVVLSSDESNDGAKNMSEKKSSKRVLSSSDEEKNVSKKRAVQLEE